MRSIVAILSVLFVAFSAVAIADFSSADVAGNFDVGDFSYKILNSSEVELFFFNEDSQELNVVIPATVVNPDDPASPVYKVTKVSASFNSEYIQTLTIGENVTDITYASFESDSLQAFYVAGGTTFAADDGVLFKKSGSDFHKLLRYPKGKPGDSYNAPVSIAEIGAGAFYGCSIATVTLHEGLIKIDYSAFETCDKLSNLRTDTAENTLPSSVSIIGNSAFAFCAELKTIILPEDLAYVGSSAFEYSGITEMNIPYGIDYIGSGAFLGCSGLVKFTSDNYVYKVQGDSGVLYKNENNQKILYAYPAGAPAKTYQIPEDFATIAPYAFSGCVNLEEVILNETCISIPDMAFYKCTSLKTMNLDGIMTIGSDSFGFCENLSSVNFGSKLTYIDLFAFENTGLESVTIPASVMLIDSGAFSSCVKLKEVIFPEGSKATLESVIFSYDDALTDIYIESGDVELTSESLSVSMNEFSEMTVDVHVVKGYSIPDDAANEYTHINTIVIGERPYPWENWIGVFFCVLVVIGILLAVREV